MYTRIAILLLCFAFPSLVAKASDCLAVAESLTKVRPVSFTPVALAPDQVQLTFIGHSTFLIESPGGVKIATDYAG